jgi:heat shock protein HslJ
MLVAACSGAGWGAAEPGSDLYGSSFVSVEIREDGEPSTLVSDPVFVGFEDEEFAEFEKAALVRWDAGCNEFEALIEIERDALVAIPHAITGPRAEGESPLTPVASATSRSCPDSEHDQDERLVQFFLSELAWSLEGERLVLASDTTELVLEQR